MKSGGNACTSPTAYHSPKLDTSCSLQFLIIYMKKFLHFDWLRAVQFFSKTVQKRGNSVEKEETNQAF